MQRFDERKKEAFKELARQAIYEAMLVVIKAHGYDDLTMQRVASAAGIATGTLYNYFKNKDELLIHAKRKMHEQFLDFIKEINVSEISAHEKMIRLIEGVYRFAEKHIEFFVVMDQANLCNKIPRQEMLDNHIEFETAFVTIIRDGIKEQCFRKVDPAVTGELFSMTLRGMIGQKAKMGTVDVAADQQKVMEFFLYYLDRAHA